MESSSEDSFTWTETSKDSIDSDSMAVDGNVNSNSDRKHGKKRKTKEISGDSYNGTEEDDSKIKVKIEKDQLQSEAKTNESMKRKLVKSEPESDCDVPKKKKKKKSIEVNGNLNDSQDSYDESHLDLKVKEEQTSAPLSKKKRKQSIIDPDNTENAKEFKTNDNSSDVGEETEKKHKKKKKKSKKRNDSEAEDGMEIEYKEDTTETAMNTSNSKRSINKSIENSTFQDESNYEEISAIQCDGDSNSHTISFNDSQTVVKDNSKKTDTLYKSTVVNQFKIANNAHDVSQEPQKRTPRISDRIRFEEDEDDPVTDYSEVQEEKQDRTSTKLRKFIKSNNDVKLVSQKLEHNSVLTEEDEIWIVKCPKEIDIQSFCDRDLNLNGKCKLKIDGQTYEGSLDEDQSETIAALSMEHGKYEVENLPLCGIINFRKRIPKPHFHNDNVMVNNQTNFIPLPETKCRHPLFGLNYKKAIKVPVAVAGRLNVDNNVEELETVVKRKKKKHKKDKDAVDYEETDSNSMKPEPDISPEKPEKKKKKRKHVDDVDVVDGPAPKKVKRIKHDPESAEAWESEKAIEENLFNF